MLNMTADALVLCRRPAVAAPGELQMLGDKATRRSMAAPHRLLRGIRYGLAIEVVLAALIVSIVLLVV